MGGFPYKNVRGSSLILHFVEVPMNKKIKTAMIQLTGLLLCFVCALAGTLYYINRPEEVSEPEEDLHSYLNNTTDDTTEEKAEYDPLADLGNVKLPEEDRVIKQDYYEKSKNYNMTATLRDQGYSRTSASFDILNTKLGVLPSISYLPKEYSLTTHKVNKTVTTTHGWTGALQTEYEKVTEDCPVLTPYYGYIIYRAKYESRLLDSNGNTLMSSFDGYEPAYMTDYAGNPLFIKNDKYYFYYTGKNYKGSAYSEIDNDTIKSLPANVPTAYQYFNYDRDMLLNYFATNKIEDAGMTGTVYYLPDHAGMVEFAVNPDDPYGLTLPVQNYNTGNGELFRFPEYIYTKKETGKQGDVPLYSFEVNEIKWGYMNKKGDVVIPPQFAKAYNFNESGLAAVEDKDGHLFIINEWGSVVFNAFHIDHYFPELGYQRVRDGHYPPDTPGIENIGMLRYDNGYIRVRRKLVDTENGYIVRREMDALVDTEGNAVNLPPDYEIIGYTDGIMLIKRGEKYGYMRANGSWLVEPELVYAQPFCEGVAVMGYSDDTLSLIDTEGNTLLYGIYSYISNCSGGVITAWSPVGGWSIFHKMSTVKEKSFPADPTIELKMRAIAEAKHEFYVLSKEEKNETEVPADTQITEDKK